MYGYECSTVDANCGEYAYCGVDKQCHSFAGEEKEIVDKQITREQGLVLPAYFIGVALIGISIIWKRKYDK